MEDFPWCEAAEDRQLMGSYGWQDADVQKSGSLKIQGEAVHAILGGTMMQFVS